MAYATSLPSTYAATPSNPQTPDLKGHLIIDEEAAAVVREVFTLFSQGYGKTAIARILNDRGIPNPTEYKRVQGLRFSLPPSKNSTLWKYFAISDMLTNEYNGHLTSREAGSVGGQMVKKMIEAYEQGMQ